MNFCKTNMGNPLKILYCSSLCSEKMLDFLFKTSLKKPLQSVQKFHRLFAEGIISNGYEITALSSIPVSSSNYKKIWWNKRPELNCGIKYVYLPFINFPFIRQFFVTIFTFIQTFWWCLKNKRRNSVIICDVLNVSISATSLICAKICGIKACAIVTDIPVMLGKATKQKRKSLLEKLSISISSSLISSYNCYVLLTHQMNNLVNIHQKPYIIMEGLVDIKMGMVTSNSLNDKASERILIYSGGIYEKYGIKDLIEAFIRLEAVDLRLHIYGDGEMENDMPHFMNLDKRIIYFGVVPNHVVVEKQMKATLLINPRPSKHEFTKYSFPSKNMEYMVSGTPLVTTPLPGMPDEYRDYVYIFADESVEGLYLKLKFLLSKPRMELHNFGYKAKNFVLSNKNNIIQAKRLISLLERVCNQ